MLNYVAINRYYDRIEIKFDPNEEEIKLNFEKKITKAKIQKYFYNKMNFFTKVLYPVVVSHIRLR
jgi:hypothetical protein